MQHIPPHDSPFLQDLQAALEPDADKKRHFIYVNDKRMPRCIYNLIISRRDISLWSKGIRPHRAWRVNPVKKYFGLKGRKEVLPEQMEFLIRHYVHGEPFPEG